MGFSLFLNAGRSQMARRSLTISWTQVAHAISARPQPAEQVHPEVVAVMRERGIDLFSARPQKLTDELTRGANLLVTMGCGEQCPFIPGLRRADWPLPDPKGKEIEHVRRIRDKVDQRVRKLLREILSQPALFLARASKTIMSVEQELTFRRPAPIVLSFWQFDYAFRKY